MTAVGRCLVSTARYARPRRNVSNEQVTEIAYGQRSLCRPGEEVLESKGREDHGCEPSVRPEAILKGIRHEVKSRE